VLAAVSGTTLAMYLSVNILVPASSASEAFVRYGLCLLAMPILLWILAGAIDASQRGPLARLLATAALGFLPLVMVLVIASVSGTGGW
jgi:hypothetical protein